MEDINTKNLNNQKFVGFWKRVLINIIDFIIVIIPYVYLYRFGSQLAYKLHSVLPLMIDWFFLLVYIIFMTVRYGGTPGKLIFGTRILDQNENYITVFKAIQRTIFLIINGCILISIRIAIFYNHETSILIQISGITGCIVLLESLVILTNKKKKALHDFIAQTHVVSKNSMNK